MIINDTNLQALRSGFSTRFTAGIAAAALVGAQLSTSVTSSTKTETYGFLGDLPKFRKWVGEKRIRSIQEKSYVLANDDFEATIGIHKNKIRDDNLGLYGPLVEGWGKSAAMLPDQLRFDALANGHQRLCYDGQYFFDTDHVIPDQNNTVVANMSGNAAVQPWFLVDLSQPLAPLLYQERQAPVFNMVTDPEDSHVFKTGEYLMGGEARGACGYTFWQLAHRCTNTLDTAGFQGARTLMTSLTDDEGQPLGVRPTHIVVGESNLAAAKALFDAQTLANGASNIWYKALQIIEAPRLA